MLESLVTLIPESHESQASLLTYGLFLRLFGLVYLVQFASALPQVLPILGREGIEPARLLLKAARRDLRGLSPYLKFPTLCWLDDGDRALRGLCVVGMLAALGIVTGIAGPGTPLLFLVAWLCWLSIVTVGSTCFGLPWDKLLVEAGFLALFMPGLQPLPELAVLEAPMPVAVLAFRWLVFRVMFGMGLAKFRTLDRETRDGTFLQRYYDRQPMPTVLAFHVQALPLGFHKFCLAAFFLTEMVLPFLAFGPWEARAVTSLAFMGLQVVIWLTGNYGIFNLLVLVLSVPLLAGDFAYGSVLFPQGPGEAVASAVLFAHFLLSLPYAFLLDSWSGSSWLYSKRSLSAHTLFRHLGPLIGLYRWLAPFHVLNAYGIFVPGVFRNRRMSTVLQGSNDQQTWFDYEPRFLPCATTARPRRFAPHHPRFDHYIYYERGLSSYRTFPWLWQTNPYYLHPYCFKEKVVQKLLRGEKAPLFFFRNNPFPGQPPKWIRYSSWVYEFTTPEERARTGHWWRRELVGQSEPIAMEEQLDELAGLQDDYRPFLSDNVCYLRTGAVAYTDPKSGEKIPIQLHPIQLTGTTSS
jgi:hypothetical protein